MRKPPISRLAIVASIVLYCLLIVAPLFFGATKIWAASLVYLLVVPLVLLTCAKLLFTAEDLKWDWLDLAMAGLWLLVVLGWWRSPCEFQSRLELLQSTAGIFVYVAVRVHVRRMQLLYILFWVLASVGLMEALYGIYQSGSQKWWVLWQPQYAGFVGRASGSYICPNHFSGFLEICIPLTLAVLIWGGRRPVPRIWLTYMFVVELVALYASHSRGGALAVCVGILAVLFLGARRKAQVLILGIGILALVLGATASYVGKTNPAEFARIQTAFQNGDWSRFQMWKSAWAIFEDHPLTGAGPMIFDFLHANHRFGQIARATYVHNDYLQVLSDYGLVGAIVVSAIILCLARSARASYLKFGLGASEDERDAFSDQPRWHFQRAFVIGGWGSVAALMAHSAVDFNLHILANMLTLTVLIGCLCSLSGVEKTADLPSLRKLVAAGLLIVLMPFGWLTWKTFESDRHCRQARLFNEPLDWGLAEKEYEQALKIDRSNFQAASEYAELLYTRTCLRVINREELAGRFFDASEVALKANPFAAQMWIRRGEVFDLLGKEELAGAEFLKATGFDPENPFYLNKSGMHYKQWNHSKTALGFFERAAQTSSGSPAPGNFANENIRAIREYLDEK